MEINPLILIGIALATMFFGYFFGLFEGRGQGYKRRKKEEAADSALASSSAPPASAAVAAPRDHSLLRLALDGSQKPRLELDGQPADVSALGADQRKRLIDLMLVMRPWIEAAPATRASAPAQPATSAGEANLSPSAALGDQLADASNAAPAFDTTSRPASVIQPSQRVSPTRAAPEPGSPFTMVGQIDAILQSRLTGTALAGRGIRVIESAEGGAAIVIGTARYAGVGDVPDSEVKDVIKAAIAEWEEKYTPS